MPATIAANNSSARLAPSCASSFHTPQTLLAKRGYFRVVVILSLNHDKKMLHTALLRLVLIVAQSFTTWAATKGLTRDLFMLLVHGRTVILLD